MAAEKRAPAPRRPTPRREAGGAAPSGEELRQLQILNDRICQVMEALRRLHEAGLPGAEGRWPPEAMPPNVRPFPPGGSIFG
jgi:hypothetical protein